MVARLLLVLAASLVLAVAPAEASSGTQVPEGSSVTLFALGLAGLMIGRRIAAKRRRGDSSED